MFRAGVSCALVLLFAHAASPQGARERMLGTWRGTSLCVNRDVLPACNDEEVVYDITAVPGEANAIAVKADKIVDGKRVPMGDGVFTQDATPDSWTNEIATPRVHALWTLTSVGRALTGVMTLLPSKTVVRKMELRRAQGRV